MTVIMEDTVFSTGVEGVDFMQMIILLSCYTHGFHCVQDTAPESQEGATPVTMDLSHPKHKLGGHPMVQVEEQLSSTDLSGDTDPDQLYNDNPEIPHMLTSGCSKVHLCPVCQQESE